MPLHDNLKPDPSIIPRDVAKEQIVGALKELFKDAESRKRLEAMNAQGKPKHWKKITNAPYYKEKCAIELKAVIDLMMTDGEDRIYRYEEFPNLSKNSLYLRVNQSKLYLLAEMDPDGRYKSFFDNLSITRESAGVRISFVKDARNGSDFMPSKVITLSSHDEIRQQIDTFLEHGKSGEEFFLQKLQLSPEEIETLDASLVSLEGIVYNITSGTIKIVKINDN